MARGANTKRTSDRTGKVSWLVRVELWPDPVTGNRRQGSETFRTRKEAKARLAEWLREIAPRRRRLICAHGSSHLDHRPKRTEPGSSADCGRQQ